MSEKLLDEYVRITCVIENIQKKINQYRGYIENIINNADNEREQEQYVNEFKNVMDDIKNDSDITRKYRKLRNRQQELKKIILLGLSKLEIDEIHAMTNNDNNNDDYDNNLMSETDITLHKLRKKYESNVLSENTDRANNYCLVIQEIQNNLEQNEHELELI